MANKLHLVRAAPATDFARTFPTLASFADEWPRSTSAKWHALSDSQVALSGTFTSADRIPLRPIPWLFIIPGLLLALAAGAILVPTRSRAVVEPRASGALSPS